MPPRSDVSATYGDVDRSADPAEAAQWMDRVAEWPGFGDAKARVRQVLGAAGRVLDVGCGVGNDVRALGSGAVGIDPSRTMVAVARQRGGTFVLGSGSTLPFAAGRFGGVRADRVLQHVPDPDAVAAELVRVTAPGGVVAVTDPDQASLRIEGPDPDLAAVVEDWRRAGIRHGFLPARMVRLLGDLGCVEVAQERFAIVLEDPADAFGITSWAPMLVAQGAWPAADGSRFDASLAAAGAAGTFRYRIDLALTWAKAPAGGT